MENKIINILEKFPCVLFSVLYGSHAAGRATERSDVDIAVAGEGKIPSDRLVDLNLELEKCLGKRVDIVDLNRVYGIILTEILTKGKVLINKKPEIYAELMKRMIYYNEDMLPLYRKMLRAKARRFASGK